MEVEVRFLGASKNLVLKLQTALSPKLFKSHKRFLARSKEDNQELFPPPPTHTHTFQDDVFTINYISIAFPMKQFSFKFILRVIV